MSSSLSLEYSIFGRANPLVGSDTSIEQEFVDTYFVMTPRATLKQRRGIVKYKAVIDSIDGIDFFHVQQFNAEPEKDPLHSFLQLRGFEEAMSGEGIRVAKRRNIYLMEGVKVYYTTLEFLNQRDTNLTITSRDMEKIQQMRAQFGLLDTNNLNYGAYLEMHVSSH